MCIEWLNYKLLSLEVEKGCCNAPPRGGGDGKKFLILFKGATNGLRLINYIVHGWLCAWIYLGFRRRAGRRRLFRVILVVEYLHFAATGPVFHVVQRAHLTLGFYLEFLVLNLHVAHMERQKRKTSRYRCRMYSRL